MWGRKYRYERTIRRRITGQKKVPYGESSSDSVRDNDEDYSSSSDDDDDGGGDNRDGADDTKDSGELEDTSDADSDGTEDYEQQGSSSVVVPKFDLLPGQGYRGGKSRAEGLASLVRDTTFEVVKHLSPRCDKGTAEELEAWRRSFRGKIRPGVPGADAEVMDEIQKKRARPIERKGKSIIKVDNGREKFIKDIKGTPMPKKSSDRMVSFTGPCDEVPVCDAGGVARCSKPFCKFRPPSAKKRKVGDPLLMINDAEGIITGALSLHPLNYVGMDTCSARSISSEVSDFLYVDRSERAKLLLSLMMLVQVGQ